jgi:large conductance mechanosensitive channel
VLEVALGLIIGSAFTGVVTSLVSDIILPPISLLSQSSKNLANYFIVLRQGETPDAIYNTVEQAADDGKRARHFLVNHDRSNIYGLGTLCAKGIFCSCAIH